MEKATFQALVEPHLPGLYRSALLILLDRELARDAVQEALVRAYRNRDRIRPDENPRPWLQAVLLNEARRLYGRQRRQPALLAELPELPLAREAGPEELLLTQERRDQMLEALAALSEIHRTVIVLRYYQGLSEAEMASLLGVSPGTIKSRLHHARQRLEPLLKAEAQPRKLNPLVEGRLPHA